MKNEIISDKIEEKLWDLVCTINEEKELSNGITALYWHLHAIIHEHRKR